MLSGQTAVRSLRQIVIASAAFGNKIHSFLLNHFIAAICCPTSSKALQMVVAKPSISSGML